jgi:hypothetical protein
MPTIPAILTIPTLLAILAIQLGVLLPQGRWFRSAWIRFEFTWALASESTT